MDGLDIDAALREVDGDMAERKRSPVRFVARTPDGRECERIARERVYTHAVARRFLGEPWRIWSWHTGEHLAIRMSRMRGSGPARVVPVRSMVALSAAQQVTLAAIVKAGGEINGYAGQQGIYTMSVKTLVDRGLLDEIGTCRCYLHPDEGCDRVHVDLDGDDSRSCFNRVRVNQAGRRTLAAYQVKG